MGDVFDLFVSDYFLVGLRLSLVALILAWVVWALVRRRWPLLGVVGVLIAATVVATLSIVEETIDPAIIPSLLLIAGGVGLAMLVRGSNVMIALAAVPGSLWLAVSSDVTELVWVRVVFALLIPVGGYLINDFELRHEGLGLGVIYYALAVLGMFGAVPDTEWAVTLFGVSWVLLFLAWPRVVGSLGPMGSFLAVAVFLWVSAHGGAPRNASIVGAVAGLGLLLLEPIIIAFNPRAIRVERFVKRNAVGAIVASVPQFMVVLICSRVAGRFTSEIPALVIVGFVYAAVLALGRFSARDETEVVDDVPIV